jgi:hypothetical protein
MNLIDVTRQFPSEDACLAFLEGQRWPDGVVRCTVCGCARVSVKHLHRYLTEFEYRFNARKVEDRFGLTVREMVTASPMQYKELTADPPAVEFF